MSQSVSECCPALLLLLLLGVLHLKGPGRLLLFYLGVRSSTDKVFGSPRLP